MKNPTVYRLAITTVFGILAILHLAVPSVNIDATALVLLVLAASPWLALFLKSFEWPGGGKIVFRDLVEAAQRVQSAAIFGDKLEPVVRTKLVERVKPDLPADPDSGEAPTSTSALGTPGTELDFLRELSSSNPALPLVSLRIEIERRLRAIAKSHGIRGDGRSLGGLLRELKNGKVLPPELASGLNELIRAGNRAAHGADVPLDAAEWAARTAPEILDVLSEYLGD